MKRLETADDRAMRVFSIGAVLGCVFIAVALVISAVRDGWPAVVGLAGGLVIACLVAWVIHWVITGRWFR